MVAVVVGLFGGLVDYSRFGGIRLQPAATLKSLPQLAEDLRDSFSLARADRHARRSTPGEPGTLRVVHL